MWNSLTQQLQGRTPKLESLHSRWRRSRFLSPLLVVLVVVFHSSVALSLCYGSGPHICFLPEARVVGGVGSFNPPFLFGIFCTLLRSSSNKTAKLLSFFF
jgi:hypothetical protein